MKLSTTTLSGMLMLGATIIALIWANSPWNALYEKIIHLDIYFGIGKWGMNKSFQHWVNDGLMAVFFFYIGLELKREFKYGILSTGKRALLPVFMAVGGAVVPALIYLIINFDTPFLRGWAIPMATDVAFALAVASLFRAKTGSSFIVLLMGVAVVDDLMSVLVIAGVYTNDIAFLPLGAASIGLGILLLINRLNVQQEWVYLVGGTILLWLPMLASGVHPTLAGVLTALCIPSTSALPKKEVSHKIKETGRALIRSLDNMGETKTMTHEELEMLDDVEDQIEQAISPMQQIERELKSLTYLFILPVFAFSNVGIHLSGAAENPFANSIFLAVVLGLVIGKPIGILTMTYFGKVLGLVHLPKDIGTKQLFGLSCLAGIGFTMSLFITDLAFDLPDRIIPANLAILIGSAISALIFVVWIKYKISPKGSKQT